MAAKFLGAICGFLGTPVAHVVSHLRVLCNHIGSILCPSQKKDTAYAGSAGPPRGVGKSPLFRSACHFPFREGGAGGIEVMVVGSGGPGGTRGLSGGVAIEGIQTVVAGGWGSPIKAIA